jgi:hypothetical protein
MGVYSDVWKKVFMPLDWAPFVELVRRHQCFLLTTHIRPDGDGIGSMLIHACPG